MSTPEHWERHVHLHHWPRPANGLIPEISCTYIQNFTLTILLYHIGHAYKRISKLYLYLFWTPPLTSLFELSIIVAKSFLNMALCNICVTSSTDNLLRTTTLQRLNRALFKLNDGFSVVAPINVIVPFSTCGRNVSCCNLLNLWQLETNHQNRSIKMFNIYV